MGTDAWVGDGFWKVKIATCRISVNQCDQWFLFEGNGPRMCGNVDRQSLANHGLLLPFFPSLFLKLRTSHFFPSPSLLRFLLETFPRFGLLFHGKRLFQAALSGIPPRTRLLPAPVVC